ncbi:hypothetical protein I350_01777 [Cryptococcus amylolentus CBS 6273]|uniref:SIT4 phosphatase-associated protein n=1 Tax=Cryptococcus amylolentus CBS 6273 TaxID=1296118 RepID=A0A1E3KE58_9TREE|nr:hypothetical protein I350_01777 [Cryptococcus amylolentus CBS 6273]
MLWRFNLASTSTLDSLLTREVPPTLEELMDEPDVLTECKGQNNRLVTFLSREDSAKSLLQWVVAGLDELDQAAADADDEIIAQAITSPDLYPAYKAPTPLVIPGAGPGSPPLEPAKLGEVNGDQGRKEGEVEEEEDLGELNVPGLGQGLRRKSEADDDISRSKYPTTATEILTCQEIWSIADTIIRNADTLLTPFWDAVVPPIDSSTPTTNEDGFASMSSSAILARQEAGERDRARNEFWSEKDEERDRRREIIRGLWMRVNAALLVKRGSEMVRFIQTLPNIVERLLARISSPAVQSLLITLISREEGDSAVTIDWLADEKLVPRLLNILSPEYPSSQHTIVSDLIKQIITLCAPSPFNPLGGNAELQAGQGQAGGRDNRLIRELVSEESVDKMIGYMLDDIELSDAQWKGRNGEDTEAAACDPFIVHPLPSIASATSSLVEISSILIEIIRRNNSDFSEPHLFHTLRNRLISVRMQEVSEERESEVVGEGEKPEATEDEQEEKERKHMEDAMVDMSSKMGIVHLGHLLDVISERFAKLQALVLQPRSQERAASVSNPKPFTMERFRIIELYAELLHSSNMSILNRLPGTGPIYNGEGILSGGLEGLEALGEAIVENDNDGAADTSRGDDDLVTQARELPVSDSTGGSLSGSDDVESEDEDVLEAANDDTTPSPSPGSSSLFETPLTFDSQPPPPTVEVSERLRDMMETESQRPSSSAASEVASATSRMAEASSTAAPSIASDPPEPRDETPHVSTKPLPADTPLAPGDKLKEQYLINRVMPSIVDLFFDYPENDFMHHVVYDIFQQVLNGKLGQGLNRDLIVQLMGEGRLVERVLDAQRLNDELVKKPRGARLPYMGHLMLIAEEIVKFFARCPSDLFALIEDTFVHTEWEEFVNTSLREAKAKDEKPLAGGKPEPPPGQNKDDSASEEDDDDEPEEGSGGMRFGEPLTRTQAKDNFTPRGEFDAYADHDENGDGEDDEETMDRYWKNSGLGLARRGVADSSDEDDDDDADWLQPPGGNSWSASGDDDDFGAWETGEVAHPGTGDDFDNDAWGNFASGPAGDSAENPFDDDFGDDNFAPSVIRAEPQRHQDGDRGEPLTPLDWAEQFDRAFREGGGDDTPPGSSPKQTAQDQGKSPEKDVAKEVVPIVMPSLDDDEGDDDVSLAMSKSMEMSVSAGTNSWTFAGDDAGVDLPPTDSPIIPDIPKSPVSPARQRSSSIASSSSDSSTASTAATATPGGGSAPIPIPKRRGSKSHSRTASLSRSFGHRPHPGHPVTSPSSSPSSSHSSLSSPTSPSRVQRWGEAFSPPDPALIAAATQDSPLGPGVSPDTKITEDGLLEREVNGKQVRVPQDEIVEAIERNADEQETESL